MSPTRDGLARRLRLSVGGVILRRCLLRPRRAVPAPLNRGRRQGLGRVAIGHGISSRREDVVEFRGREAERRQVEIGCCLRRGQRIAQQRLVPGRVLRDAVVGEPQRLLLRGGEMPQHDRRHLLDAERHRGLEPAVTGDQHAVLVDQQRVGEAEGQHAGLDLLDLRGGVHAGIAGMRAQLRHRAQQDLRCHPGERHRTIRSARVGGRWFAPNRLRSLGKTANHDGAGCEPAANHQGHGSHLRC
jgi:hypothetical protein